MAKVQNITEGPIYSTIFRLAWPVITSMLLEFALTVTDYFWVGFLGTPQQDAIMTSMIVSWTMFTTISIIVTGLTATVSRAIGAGNKEEASYLSRQGIQMAIGLGLIFSVLGINLAPVIMKFLKAGDNVIELGIPYLRIFFISLVLYYVIDGLGAIFRASGDTKSPTIAYATATIINIILDPLLIFGVGPFPKMGVTGAAVATFISVVICFLILLFMLFKGRLEFPLTGWYRLKPHLGTMLRIFKIGLPISLQNLTFVMVYWFIVQMVHQYGDAAGAAMGIGNRLESLSYLVAFGFSIASSTMVGQNLGAGKPDRAEKCAWGAVSIIIAETLTVSVLFLTIPSAIASIFTQDPQTQAIAKDYLMILGLSQVFMGIEIVLEGSFSGAGDTIPPMSVSIPGSILRLPIAYYLCFTVGLGINGIWWSLTITSVLKAIVLFFWFRRGLWKKKKV